MKKSRSRFVGNKVIAFLSSMDDFCEFTIVDFFTEPDEQCYYKVKWENGRTSFINTSDVVSVDFQNKPDLKLISNTEVIHIGSRKNISDGKAQKRN